MNEIPTRQNQDHSIKLLAAQRQLYLDAKKLNNCSILIALSATIFSFFSINLFPEIRGFVYLAVGIATLFERIYLSQKRKKLQKKAATVQQRFDSEVLDLDLEENNISRVTPETIRDASARYKCKQENCLELYDWYTVDVGKLELYKARVICQRANVSWDSNLRRFYAEWIIYILLFLLSIGIIIGLVGGVTLYFFLSRILVPMVPIFNLAIPQSIENFQAATRLDASKFKLDSIIEKLKKGIYNKEEIEKDSYQLQRDIYENRCNNPLIFEWIYLKLRNKFQTTMNEADKELISQIKS